MTGRRGWVRGGKEGRDREGGGEGGREGGGGGEW